ncbi:MAG TPA: Abi-alpha family protein [Paludibacteraceae bacterium]|nr:Abi-alpha family protein [Paludibacteraceae bacterium]
MEKENLLGLIKGVPYVLGLIYTDAAQPSVQAVGKALGTVFEFSTSFLLPVKLLNEKFRLNFEKRIKEYEKKLEQIPEEKRVEVQPQIGTPIIEKLSYTTSDEISDLFTTLLANASNADMINTAHYGTPHI